MRNLLVGLLGGAICFIVAVIVGTVINMLFPVEGQAYVGIGLDSRNLPGTVLGICAWIGFAVLMSRKFQRRG
jgi:TM2 domain-containing membrane protein YozV